MAVAATANEVLHLTVSVPKDVAAHIRSQVSSGAYANESEYVESMLVSEGLFEAVDQDELTHWINTEGVRRLRAMEADPSSTLTEEQVFGFLDDDLEMTSKTKEAI